MIRIAAFDPGNRTLGWAVLDCCPDSSRATVVNSETLMSKRSINLYDEQIETHGERFMRLHYLSVEVTRRLRCFSPNLVATESPFMGRFPAAFESLVECKYMLKQTVGNYDPHLLLHEIDPTSAKVSVGAKTKSTVRVNGCKVKIDLKEDARQAVLKLQDLYWDVNPNVCSEHEIDAVTVAYCLWKRFLEEKGKYW